MPLVVTTTLRNITEDTFDEIDSIPHEVVKLLLKCQDEQLPVTVDCKATDGYYDITLFDGTTVDAISFYHLDGFDYNGNM